MNALRSAGLRLVKRLARATVGRVIRDPDRLFLSLVRQDRQTAEDFPHAQSNMLLLTSRDRRARNNLAQALAGLRADDDLRPFAIPLEMKSPTRSNWIIGHNRSDSISLEVGSPTVTAWAPSSHRSTSASGLPTACGSGVAGLAGILKHVQHAGFHGALRNRRHPAECWETCAELLVYSFDGVSSQLGDFGTRTG